MGSEGSDNDAAIYGVVIVDAPNGRLSRLVEPLSNALKSLGAVSRPRWWAPDDLRGGKIDSEQIIRDLAGAPLFVFDVANGLDLAGYLLGAREALSQYPSLVAFQGDQLDWRIPGFPQDWVDLDDIDRPGFDDRLKQSLFGLVPTTTNAHIRRNSSGFRKEQIVTVHVQQRELEPTGVERVRAKLRKSGNTTAPDAARVYDKWVLASEPDAPIVGMTYGDIASVKGIPAWINSENVDMQMARVADRSVSARVRALGARYTGADGKIDDAMFIALAREMGGRSKLAAGEVLLTWTQAGSQLYDVNGVRLVAHVAAVEPRDDGPGYAAAPNLRQCLLTAISELEDRFDQEKVKLIGPTPHAGEELGDIRRAVLCPLLGAGDGGVGVSVSAHMMADALEKWSELYAEGRRKRAVNKRAKTEREKYVCVDSVYLLARDLSTRKAIEGALVAHRFERLADRDPTA